MDAELTDPLGRLSPLYDLGTELTIRPRGGANKARKGADLLGFDSAALLADNKAGQNVYMIVGRATAASGIDKHGNPTGAVTDEDVADCPCLFVEWDDRPKAEQLRAWEELGLPRIPPATPPWHGSRNWNWNLPRLGIMK
jgi:hypothetical protein